MAGTVNSDGRLTSIFHVMYFTLTHRDIRVRVPTLETTIIGIHTTRRDFLLL